MIYRYYDEKGLAGYLFEKGEEEKPFLNINIGRNEVEIGKLEKQDIFRYEKTDSIEESLVRSLGKSDLEDLLMASVEIKTQLEQKLELQPWFKGYAETLKWNARDVLLAALGGGCIVFGASSLYLSNLFKEPELYMAIGGVCIGVGIGAVATRLKDALAYFKAKKAIAKERPFIKNLIDRKGFNYKAFKWDGGYTIKLKMK